MFDLPKKHILNEVVLLFKQFIYRKKCEELCPTENQWNTVLRNYIDVNIVPSEKEGLKLKRFTARISPINKLISN